MLHIFLIPDPSFLADAAGRVQEMSSNAAIQRETQRGTEETWKWQQLEICRDRSMSCLTLAVAVAVKAMVGTSLKEASCSAPMCDYQP